MGVELGLGVLVIRFWTPYLDRNSTQREMGLLERGAGRRQTEIRRWVLYRESIHGELA